MIRSLFVQSDGKILFCGEHLKTKKSASNCINRMHIDGSHDTLFEREDMSNNDLVRAVVEQRDSRLIVAGTYMTMANIEQNYVTCLSHRGKINTDFIPLRTDDKVNVITKLKNGPLLIGGAFSRINDVACSQIVRLNEFGTLDTDFVCELNSDGAVLAISEQSDGKLLAAGSFTNPNTNAPDHIARLNISGSLDPSFNIGNGTNDWVFAVQQQSDGKVLIGGVFTKVNDTPKKYIARLNQDGSLDNSFKTDTGTLGWVYAIEQQPDNKILIAGEFTTIDGTDRHYIARLNNDGTLDKSFEAQLDIDEAVKALKVQKDGKILIGGNFTSIKGLKIKFSARLNSNGDVDKHFNYKDNIGDSRLNGIIDPCHNSIFPQQI